MANPNLYSLFSWLWRSKHPNWASSYESNWLPINSLDWAWNIHILQTLIPVSICISNEFYLVISSGSSYSCLVKTKYLWTFWWLLILLTRTQSFSWLNCTIFSFLDLLTPPRMRMTIWWSYFLFLHHLFLLTTFVYIPHLSTQEAYEENFWCINILKDERIRSHKLLAKWDSPGFCCKMHAKVLSVGWLTG